MCSYIYYVCCVKVSVSSGVVFVVKKMVAADPHFGGSPCLEISCTSVPLRLITCRRVSPPPCSWLLYSIFPLVIFHLPHINDTPNLPPNLPCTPYPAHPCSKLLFSPSSPSPIVSPVFFFLLVVVLKNAFFLRPTLFFFHPTHFSALFFLSPIWTH